MSKGNSQSPSSSGQGLVEYALLIALVVIIIILVLQIFGITLQDVYCQVATTLGGGETCQIEKKYCEDNFAGDMDGWNNLYQSASIQDEKLCMNRYSMMFNQCSIDENDSDYTVNISGVNLNRGNGYGIFFRATNTDRRQNGYIFQYDPGYGSGAFLFRKWVNGRETAPFARVFVPGYQWHGTPRYVQVKVEGNTFTAFVDGEPVLTATDDTYSEGSAGLRTWNGTDVCFDNFSLGTLP